MNDLGNFSVRRGLDGFINGDERLLLSLQRRYVLVQCRFASMITVGIIKAGRSVYGDACGAGGFLAVASSLNSTYVAGPLARGFAH